MEHCFAGACAWPSDKNVILSVAFISQRRAWRFPEWMRLTEKQIEI